MQIKAIIFLTAMLPINLFGANFWHSGGQQIPTIIDSNTVK